MALGEGHATKVQRNVNIAKCGKGVFFSEVQKGLLAHLAKYPDAKIVNLSIGDATEPIPRVITSAMEEYARALSTPGGFSGYTFYHGNVALRNAVSEVLYNGLGLKSSEIFMSDGAKGCLARLHVLFGSDVTVAICDPSYPVIAQISSLMAGMVANGLQDDKKLVYMKCVPENNFFPDFTAVPRTDIIHICSPNNPTGVAATRKQLEDLVAFARKNGSIILYDSVYSCFITDDSPRSIYEIPGAKEVAIEVGSFSKCAGFTGVRLGWTIVPETLRFADGQPVIRDFEQVSAVTFTAGASNIAQAGGLACLTPEGMQALKTTVEVYKGNSRILEDAFVSIGVKVFGGRNGPYLWVEFPGCWSSRDMFAKLLEEANILTVPGYLFGPSGEGFMRISAFGHREDILEVAGRLRRLQI